MVRQRSRGCVKPLAVGILLWAAGVFPLASHADVTASGLNTAVDNSTAGVYNITGGTRPDDGANLFHSFGNFSLDTPESANFLNDSGLATTNILSRVTGGNPSNIFGTINTSAFPGANLFLMNPAGILFGPTAQLNVDGSFHATTADYIKLANEGGIFYADPAQPTVLSVAAPSAFGFLTANPAPIDVLRGGIDLNTFDFELLQVPAGQTLSLVGGTLNLGAAEIRDPDTGAITQDARPAWLLAPGGRINLVSVASPGEALFDGTGFNVDGFSRLGDINMQGGRINFFGDELLVDTTVDARDVFIRGGQLVMNEAGIFPAIFSLFGLAPEPDGGEVNVQLSGDMSITGTGLEPLFENPSGIVTFAGGFLAPELFPDTKVPDITIDASSLTVSGVATVQTARIGPGNPSNVFVNADVVTVQNGGAISLLNFYEGPGGTLTINARELNLSNDGTPSPTGAPGINAQGEIHPCWGCELPSGESDFDPRLTFADAPSVTVNASDHVSISGDAVITVSSNAFGNAGNLTINTGDLSITGVGPETASILAQSFFTGDAGEITVNAGGAIVLQDGGRIAASTGGSGNAGNITVSAGESITFNGPDSRIVSATNSPLPEELNRQFLLTFGISFDELRDAFGLPADAGLFDVLGVLNALGFTAIPDLTPGDAGSVTVNAPVLTLNAGTRIEMSTGWEGNGGTLQANVGSLFLNDGGAINSRSGIRLLTGDVVVGSGSAGAVNVNATDTISISGAGSTVSTSTLGDGNGGDVFLNADNQVQINNGGSVTADSLGTGLTGNIGITAGTNIVLNKGTISTLAETSDGGNIKLTAPNIVQLTGSQITTSVESGEGGGGNINIDPQFIILNNSQITANAFGGPGGNISLTANNFVPSADSFVEASSALSTQGTIVIESPENDIAGSISQLPQSIVDVSGLLPERCAARGAGGAQSSFVVAGRGGLPTNPDNYLPSFGAGSAPMKTGGTTKSGMSLSDLRYTDQTTVAMAGWGCPR